VVGLRGLERQLECLTAVDEYTCENLAIDVAGAIGSARATEVLSGNKTPGEFSRPQQSVNQPGAIFQDQFGPTKSGRSVREGALARSRKPAIMHAATFTRTL
jgi:hypothetical protein